MSSINKIIITLLCIILAGVLIAGFARRQHTEELMASINALSRFDSGITTLQESISDLYQAENDFRLYTVTYDKVYYLKYCNGLKKIQTAVNSLQKNYDAPEKELKDRASLENDLKRKLFINKMIVDLKRSIDVALTAALQLDTGKKIAWQLPSPYYKHYKLPLEKLHRTDTVITSQKISKRGGFFHRFRTALSGVNDKDTVTVDRLSATNIQRDSALIMIRKAVRSVEDDYRENLKRQLAARNMLNSRDRELVLLNFSLIENLNSMLHSFQRQQQADQELNKSKAVEIARRSATQLSLIGSLSSLIIVLLLLLTLYNIYRVSLHAKSLLTARLDAERQTIAKSHLLASVSHEIRNPLTAIRGLTELLQNGNWPDLQKAQIKIIRSASDMLLSTVNELLDFSKLEAGRMLIHPAPLQPAKLVEEAYAIMKSLAEQKGLVLRMETHELTPGLTVQGDAFRLKQVLLNLTSNAIKFTREGQITIRAFNRATETNAWPDRDTGKRTVVHFEISDTGIGIPPDKIQDVFKEYEQVKQEDGSPIGTGLGLAICQKIVQLHAGSIDVKSELGRGSVFSVKIGFEEIHDIEKTTIPAHKIVPVTSLIEDPSPGSLKNKKILLVEDNPLVMQLAILLLEKQDASVVTAEDGARAWTLFKNHHFDMVITDINLPGINGTIIAKNIRSLPDLQKAHVPILALTGDVFGQQIDSYMAAGIDDYIIKPFNRNDFLTKVEKYLKVQGIIPS
ncbi:MAG TPA: ATP-binding protein [Puia sp.]|nr:ATP-binding protein [Puia sp.]